MIGARSGAEKVSLSIAWLASARFPWKLLNCIGRGIPLGGRKGSRRNRRELGWLRWYGLDAIGFLASFTSKSRPSGFHLRQGEASIVLNYPMCASGG